MLNVGGDVLDAPQISDTQQCFPGNTKRAVEDVGPYKPKFKHPDKPKFEIKSPF